MWDKLKYSPFKMSKTIRKFWSMLLILLLQLLLLLLLMLLLFVLCKRRSSHIPMSNNLEYSIQNKMKEKQYRISQSLESIFSSFFELLTIITLFFLFVIESRQITIPIRSIYMWLNTFFIHIFASFHTIVLIYELIYFCWKSAPKKSDRMLKNETNKFYTDFIGLLRLLLVYSIYDDGDRKGNCLSLSSIFLFQIAKFTVDKFSLTPNQLICIDEW